MLPAYAGMILSIFAKHNSDTRAPRIRGDDPRYNGVYQPARECSPHTRG